MGLRTIYLVRHGHYYQLAWPKTPTEGRLTVLGRRQSQSLTRRAATLPIERIIYSTQTRARETAEFVMRKLKEIPSQSSTLLWECLPCLKPELIEQLGIRDEARLEKDTRYAEKAFQKYFVPSRSKDTADLLVTHGNLIRFLVCRAMGADPLCWSNLEIHHCGITTCTVDSSGATRLVSFNDIGHLPRRLQTIA